MIALSLGSNVGDRPGFLQAAVDELGQKYKLRELSKVYETEPWGETDQPKFLNAALDLDLSDPRLSPEDFLDQIKQIEHKIGRTKSYRWGPRQIDIDIILWDDVIISSQRLTLPHPHFAERAFVLVPLTEFASDWVDPVSGKTVGELADAIDSSGVTATSNLLVLR